MGTIDLRRGDAMAPRRVLLPVLATVHLAAPVLAAGHEATPASPPPPGQPATGPGGAEYAISHVHATSFARVLARTHDASSVELGVIAATNPRRGAQEEAPTARGRVG
jgi:hypothetical protein